MDPGFFSPTGVHLPLPVRAGWAAGWDAVAGTPIPLYPCKAGWHSDDFANTCVECIKGELCNFPSNRPLPCNEGMESMEAGRYTCEPCLIDEVFNSGTQECEKVTQGKGAIHGMFDQEKCHYGHYSNTASIDDPDNVDCMECDPGSLCGSASTSATQTPCPDGYWCNAWDENTGAISKYPCPAGYKSSGLVGTARTTRELACTICSAGNYCEGADFPETPCLKGYWCPTGTKFATQYPCPAGTISAAGASDVTACGPCGANEFCPMGTGISRPCPPGSSCDGLQLDRYSDMCPEGQYNNGGCTNCPVDHYCPTGITYPLKCPAGYKGRSGLSGSGGGKDRLYDCELCAQGELCPRYGQSGHNSNYPQESGSGYYATFGTEFKHQFACPPGFYDNGG